MVIQRIQTVYLLLAAIVTAVFAFVPVINVLNPDGVVEISFNSLHFGAWTMVLEILIVILAIIAIFKYRDLKTQIRLTHYAVHTLHCHAVCGSDTGVACQEGHQARQEVARRQ